jgi:hypothetical protein
MSVRFDESHFPLSFAPILTVAKKVILILKGVCYRYDEIVPNSTFLVCEFEIQNIKVGQAKLARQSWPGFALIVLSSRSGLFAWPILTIGASRGSLKEGSSKKRVMLLLSIKWCVELYDSALLFGHDIGILKNERQAIFIRDS